MANSATEFTSNGYRIESGFLSSERCEQLLASINEYRKHHTLPLIHRPDGGRPLHYSVIDGERIGREFPDVSAIYRDVNRVVCDTAGFDLVPLKDEKVACNINLTPEGGTYRWHYDRNAVTALLYLNNPGGGETECYPNYRISFGGSFNSAFQHILDRILQLAIIRRMFGKLVVIEPQAGRLLIMRGNDCLHSVRPVTGGVDRVNIIMSFDEPGKDYAVADQLNDYLYTSETSASRDPNYK